MNKKDLLKLRTDIEEAKTKVTKLQGSQETLMKHLKINWSCDTLKAAEKKVEALKAKEVKLQQQLDKGLEELELIMEEVKDAD